MTTFERIQKAQQAQRLIQSVKDKAIVDSLFTNNSRPLNNNHELKKVEN